MDARTNDGSVIVTMPEQENGAAHEVELIGLGARGYQAPVDPRGKFYSRTALLSALCLARHGGTLAETWDQVAALVDTSDEELDAFTVRNEIRTQEDVEGATGEGRFWVNESDNPERVRETPRNMVALVDEERGGEIGFFPSEEIAEEVAALLNR